MAGIDVESGVVNRVPLCALFVANGVSIIGNFMTLVALPWFVLELTGSAAKTGIMALAVTLPQLLAGFFANAFIDRLGYRRTSILADLAAGGTIVCVPFLYHTLGLSFWSLVALVFVGNLLNAPGTTARQSMLPDLITLARVPRARANAWYQSLFNMSQLTGPLLAGIAIPLVGASNVLWLDAGSFLFSALVVACFIPAIEATAPNDTSSYLAQLAEGIRFLWQDRLQFGMMAATVAFSFIGPAWFNVVLPLFARHAYERPLALGMLRGGWGAGALIGSLLYAAIGEHLPRRATYIGVYALSIPPFLLLFTVPPLALGVGAMVVSAAIVGPAMPLRLTIQQERTPTALRSRVFGTSNATLFLAAPLGSLVFGVTAERHGVLVAMGGLVLIWVTVVLCIALHPVFRTMDAGAALPRRARPIRLLEPSR
jgi:MFS family permease